MVTLWEHAEPQTPLERALTILAHGYPELQREQLAALTIGQRDAHLFGLRERLFGEHLHTFVTCPACAAPLELDLSVRELCEPAARVPAQPVQVELQYGEYLIHARVPDSRDLVAVERRARSSPAQLLGVLLERCVVSAQRGDADARVSELPAELIDALAAQLTSADPLAELLLDMRCPDCAHAWQVLFDIATFLWTELSAQARRLLGEVHALAREYGWSEAAILSLSPRRRQAYLELLKT